MHHSLKRYDIIFLFSLFKSTQSSISEADPLLFDFGDTDVISMGDIPSLVEVLAVLCAVLQPTLRARSNKYISTKMMSELC